MATIFAVSLMMLLMAVGSAVDLNYMSSKRADYQNLADLAVLAAARSGEEKKSELLKIAEDAIAANNFSGETLETTVEVTKEGRLQVNVTGKYNTMIMGIFGKSELDVDVVAEAPLAINEPVDIALVLDITGSMDGDKIASLKTAAKALVDQIDGYDNSAIRMSVIPFREYVNVGLSRRNENWLEDTIDYSTPLADNCYFAVIGKENCRLEDTPYVPAQPAVLPGICDNDGVPYKCGGSDAKPAVPAGKKEVCDNIYDPKETCDARIANYVWHGCVGSRMTPWNERAHKGASRIPGLMNKYCGQEILALTDDMDAVRTKIDSLTAGQKTYLPAGLIWGWRALHAEAPLTEASSAKKKDKTTVLIFMTDGANTRSQNGKLHDGSDIDQANKQAKQLCTNIKSDGIQMYTIAYDFDGADTLKILKKCASEKDMFFLASDSEALKTAFKDIGNSIVKLRLTH